MEDLNKNQIVLLTLLVSFVTSIATGIMTTSLLNIAPVEVTRNINSIVEKTIERVVPADTLSNIKQKEITTIIVNEDDAITKSVEKNMESIVRINETDGVLFNTSFYGIGLVINKDGLISTNRKTITAINIYTATMNDGTEFKLVPLGVEKNTNFILFKVNQPEKTVYTFMPITFGNIEPRLGQTLISIGGEKSNSIAVGRIISLQIKNSIVGTTTTKYLSSIDTDISTRNIFIGSPVLNLSGDVVGVMTSLEESRIFTPVTVLKNELSILIETPTPLTPKVQ